MPIYVLTCECGAELEKICSYDTASNTACSCGKTMIIKPVRSGFQINGYSAANGYHREELSYDGTTPDSW